MGDLIWRNGAEWAALDTSAGACILFLFHSNSVIMILHCTHKFAVPCQECEEEMNALDEDPSCSPTKPTGNGGSCRVDPDCEIDPIQLVHNRSVNGTTLMKRWITWDEVEDIERELFKLAHDIQGHGSSKPH